MPQNTSYSWEASAAAKRAICLAAIPSEWIIDPSILKQFNLAENSRTNAVALQLPIISGILTGYELDMTENYSAKQLLAKLAAGEFTSEAVTLAFSKRAAIAQQVTCCLTETFFDRALERAKYLDTFLKDHGKPIGPLHGLPISIKDSFNYAGIPSTLGLISFLNNPVPTGNSAIVDMLLNLGAVLYVKTNVPQSLMTCDSHNHVFGRVLNPLNLSLTAGGSSGGESALIAFRGSILGVGTDLGGSIRMPAMCTGVYGYKPTPGRIPYAGQKSASRGGYTPLRACAGPLCVRFEDIELFMSTVIEAEPANYSSDASIAPWLPITTDGKQQKLIIGVLTEDPAWPLHPPVKRTLSTATAKLKAAGHNIVTIAHDPENSVDMHNDLMFKYYRTDPENSIFQNIINGDEPLIPSLVRMNTLGLDATDKIDLMEVGAMNRQRDAIIETWRRIWVENKLDVLMCPVAQNTAVAHDTYNYIPYTTMWNLTDNPAMVIPFLKSSKELDVEAWVISAPAKGPNSDIETDDHITNDGAPCAVQLVGRPFQDEKLLFTARIIDEILKQ